LGAARPDFLPKARRDVLKADARRLLERRGMQRYRVLYLVGRREHRSPWFASEARAQQALELLKARYGRAIIYVD
jgi:hypothetical protein